MSFIGRFLNIEVEMTKTLVDSFLEKIKQAYPYEWILDREYKTLIIHGDKYYQLPFKQEKDSLILTLEELTTNERTFSIAFNELLFEARKKMMGIENVYERKKRRAEKRQAELKAIQYQKIEKQQLKLAPPLTKEIKTNILKLEIDYLLMELHEALNIHDQIKVSSCKKRLRDLVDQLKQSG
ncbi:hypothetical protein [Alkalihalobacillus sp. BA299]|uniref:hypothetical protein n=1 Tax=Alkalihalobacillus sp. BA299 TaxID=2815938 RepID=UPI001AD98903|nr:hypothetical protein [Alkalihalobacillus sp. BA299]